MEMTLPKRNTKRQCYICFKKFEPPSRVSQVKCCSEECKLIYEIAKKEKNELDKSDR